MNTNNKSRRGIVCYVLPRQDGSVDLVLDDVATTGADPKPPHWSVTAQFTAKTFHGVTFMDVDLTETELADIGLNIVARLAALAAPDQVTTPNDE